jgi:hypothetical protein
MAALRTVPLDKLSCLPHNLAEEFYPFYRNLFYRVELRFQVPVVLMLFCLNVVSNLVMEDIIYFVMMVLI